MGFASYAIHTTLLTLSIVPNTFPATAPAAAVGNQNLGQGVLEAEETNDILTNGTSPADTDKISVISLRLFHIIGHRVLVEQGVYDALNSGVNALEIDMTAQPEGWWAEHDGNALSRGDMAQTMFETIATLRDAGRTTSFVWLEIKNPDAFNPFLPGERNGSIKDLRNLAPKILQTHRIRVLYGFYDTKSNAYISL